MRWRTTLAVFGLIAAMGMLSGCKSWCHQTYPCDAECCTDGGGGQGGEPWVKGGIVRVDRTGGSAVVLIGFFSTDPADPNRQLWILRGNESFPLDHSEHDPLLFTKISQASLPHEELCAEYGVDLDDPTMWVTTWWSEPVGPCPPELP